MEHICYENQCLTLFPTKTIYFSKKNVFFSSWDFILKQWRRGQHWRKLKVRFRFTETPFLPNHRTLPKPCFCRTSKPKPKFRSYTIRSPSNTKKYRKSSRRVYPISCPAISCRPNSCRPIHARPFHACPISCPSHFMPNCPNSCPSLFIPIPFHAHQS